GADGRGLPSAARHVPADAVARPGRWGARRARPAAAARRAHRRRDRSAAGSGEREVILAGVRVLTFTTGIAGPNAGRILASLGAEVIKVESRKGGIDAFRYFGTSDDVNSSPRFAEANFGVRSLAV